MKKLYILSVFLLFITSLYSQHKEDYIWLIGSYNNGFYSIDFNQNENKRFKLIPNIFTSTPFHNKSVLCSELGMFKYLTNGCSIVGSNFNVIAEDWDTGHWNNGCGGGYPIFGGSLLLPHPSDSTLSYFFNLRYTTSPYFIDNFKYTVLQSHADGSQTTGSDNINLSNDSLSNILTACRHGNGRDWWVITHKLGGFGFNRVLVTPDGVSDALTQDIGFHYPPSRVPNNYYMYEGQACFSPDGKYFATYYSTYGAVLYNFDRCSGLLSNPVKIEIELDSVNRAGGVAFSENSRFLYYFTWRSAYQIDIQSDDIINNSVLLDTFDWFQSPFYAAFYNAKLTPDGSIYIGCPSTNDVWHVINKPNLKGKDCNFLQHSIKLPTFSDSPPNFPYFRSGPLAGSPCDTLLISTHQPALCAWKLYPVPADDDLSIQTCSRPGDRLFITDIMGRNIYSYTLAKDNETVSVKTDSWPQGIYFLHDKTGNRSYKIIVQR